MNYKNHSVIKKINKVLNLLSFVFLIFIILICIFQFDVVREGYIKDIPNVIKYNSFQFNISNIYSNAIFYGVNIKFIIYIIIFNIFIFMPIGCILNLQKLSKKKSIIMFLMIAVFYELIKSLLHISHLGLDIIILHFIGLYLGYIITCTYISTKKDRVLKKGILLILFSIIFSLFMEFRTIYEFFFIDPSYATEQDFLGERDINDEIVEALWGKLYDPYKKYLESITKNKQIKGTFKGLFVKENYLFINISDNIYKFKINEESNIIDKQILDYDHNKIFVHPGLNKIFFNNLDNKTICKVNERLAVLVSSDCEVNVVFDQNNTLKFVYILSELYKDGVNKF